MSLCHILTCCRVQISCLIPHISAVNNTAIALSICSLFAFVLLCVTLAVHNSTERDFWSGLRDDFIEERTDVPPGEVGCIISLWFNTKLIIFIMLCQDCLANLPTCSLLQPSCCQRRLSAHLFSVCGDLSVRWYFYHISQLPCQLRQSIYSRKRYFHAHPRYRGRFVGYGRRGFYI